MASHKILEVRESRVLNTAKVGATLEMALSQEGRDQQMDLDSKGAAGLKHFVGRPLTILGNIYCQGICILPWYPCKSTIEARVCITDPKNDYNVSTGSARA